MGITKVSHREEAAALLEARAAANRETAAADAAAAEARARSDELERQQREAIDARTVRQRDATAQQTGATANELVDLLAQMEAAVVEDAAAAPRLYLAWRRAQARYIGLSRRNGGQPRLTIPTFADVVARVMDQRGAAADVVGGQDAATFVESVE